MADVALTFEYKPSMRGQTVLTAKLGEDIVYTDKLDISRAKQRNAFISAMVKDRPGIAKYRDQAAAELDRIAAALASPASDRGVPGSDREDEQRQTVVPYTRTEEGLFRVRRTESGNMLTQLTNFDARIVADVVRDDGTERQNSLEIEAKIDEETRRFTIPASSFSSLNWPIEQLGSKAIVFAGPAIKDQTRVAIQMLSGEPERRVTYTHMGWRKIGDQWAYLHVGGAIGRDGSLANVTVELGEALALYRLPDPPQGQKLNEAIAATLRRLDLAPDVVSVPTFIVPSRAAIGSCDYTVHYAGATGVFKSELGALACQHFGPGLDGRNLPGSWHATENALEGLAFTAKDAILVIDDFAPSGPPHEVQRWHQKADRIIRHQGNHNARQRMRADGSLRPPKPPRGLIVSTGEDVPRGQSLRARMLIVEVNDGDIETQKLTACQTDAAAGLYAEAMAGFVQWLAARYDDVQTTLRGQTNELRQEAAASGMHRRTPDIVASLAIGAKYFIAFAQDVGAIDASQGGALWQRCWLALGQVAAKQDAYHKASEPTRRFIELLLSALASGHAHFAGPDGKTPREAPEAWGWRPRTISGVLSERDEWQPQGDRVGWIDGDTTYLDPEASYRSSLIMVGGGADGLAITAQTLRKRMRERGLLVMEGSRETLTVRRVLEGRTRSVLQLVDGALVPEPLDIPDIPGNGAGAQQQERQVRQVSEDVASQERQVAIEERAAIMEYDAGLSREQAEAAAARLALEQSAT